MSRNFTKREKVLLVILCILLLALLYYQFVYKTTEEMIAQYDTLELETELELEEGKALNIETMEKEIEANKNDSAGVVSSYNNIKNELAVLNDIFASAASYNLDFGQAVQDGDAVRRSVNVNFTASGYEDAASIIKALHDCKYRCLIRQLSISSSGTEVGSGEVNVDMEITFLETVYNANSMGGLEESTNEGEAQ